MLKLVIHGTGKCRFLEVSLVLTWFVDAFSIVYKVNNFMWMIGGLCIDVSAPTRWFPCWHTCEWVLHVHVLLEQSWDLISESFLQIFQIAKSIGWLPAVADLKKAYVHLNSRIPNDLKFDLNCLLFTHGKACRQCSKKADPKPKKEPCSNPCPLLNYLLQ